MEHDLEQDRSRLAVTARRRLATQSWRGLKAPVKRALSVPPLHWAMRRVAPRVLPPESVWRLPAPWTLRRSTASMCGTEFVMLDPARCIVAKELYWGRGKRPGGRDQLALEVFAELAREAALVLDVGAYTGVFSLLAARVNPSARVHAFEVVPAVHRAAWANVLANDLAMQVQVHLCGLGGEAGSVLMPLGEGGSALPDFLGTDMGFDSGVRVPVRTLDDVADAEHVGGPTLVKIDVEGAEASVLAGAAHLLARSDVDLVCEVLPGADAEALRAILADHGYRTLRVGSVRLEEAELVPDARWRDWLFTRRDDANLDAHLAAAAG